MQYGWVRENLGVTKDVRSEVRTAGLRSISGIGTRPTRGQ